MRAPMEKGFCTSVMPPASSDSNVSRALWPMARIDGLGGQLLFALRVDIADGSDMAV